MKKTADELLQEFVEKYGKLPRLDDIRAATYSTPTAADHERARAIHAINKAREEERKAKFAHGVKNISRI